MIRQRTLYPGPSVPGHSVQQDDTQHVWIIDQILIRCSPMEYGCFKVLLEQTDHLVPFSCFAGEVPQLLSDDVHERRLARQRIRHAISRLRIKIWPLGLDIGNVRAEGYLLISRLQEQTTGVTDDIKEKE